mgnify:CR=1 FL=1
MWEQSKSTKRRFNDGHFHNKYFVGHGIDIGAGPDTLNRYKHIFHKGNDRVDSDGIVYPNNAPGLYISPVDDTKNIIEDPKN